MPQSPMKKEILFIRDSSIFLVDTKNKIIIIQNAPGVSYDWDLDVTSYDFTGNVCWSIWTYRDAYTIFNRANNSFFEAKGRGEFLEKIKNQYPEDFDFFLWQPEIFNGKYLESND
jgi:hypothetical protein